MPTLSFFLSSFFSRQSEGKILPELPNPIRAHYKSLEELQQLAISVAQKENILLPEYEPFVFHKRLAENARYILHVYRTTDAAVRTGEMMITPAAQWLLDNHYIIDENIQQVRRGLSARQIRDLPIFSAVHTMPRVFALVWLYVAHTDSHFSLNTLTAMINGFQTVEPLQINELWILPTAIRFIMIENARRLALRVERAQEMRNVANRTADEITLALSREELDQIFTRYQNVACDSTFATHLLYRLRSSLTDVGGAIKWLEAELEKYGSDTENVIIEGHARQSTSSVSMGNIIRSLKSIDDVDWTVWFEDVSVIDSLLRQHSDFQQLDFRSRNAHRVTIENLARRSQLSEVDITWAALKLSQDNNHNRMTGKAKITNVQKVAYYLVDHGKLELERICDYKPPLFLRALRLYRQLGLWGVAIPVAFFALIILMIVLGCMIQLGVTSGMVWLFLLLGISPAVDGAVALFHSVVPWFVPPTRLIGYEYKEGVPPEACTLVAVPTLIDSHDSIDEHIRNLEVHYLTNPPGEIYFALVTDWTDSNGELSPADVEILNYARDKIAKLNFHYRGEGQPRFFILHRHRLFNAKQNCWMGWERKRGKLHELNRLLRGDQNTSFFSPDKRLPTNVKFVMTLDADTRLMPESVTHLVGKLNHPLNRPIIDEKSGNIMHGHGILQPRVTPSLTIGDEASLLQRVFSANRGIDPYVFIVSDVYQDMLDEGTFIGKGLYDIDAFEAVLKGRIKENTILSHDLLEGGYARSALVSDIEIIEDYPTGYNVDVLRHHRWTRGDWQLLPYLFSSNRSITSTTRWKMADNLRRSLNPVFWIIAAITGWSLLPLGVGVLWQFFLLASMFVAPIFGLITSLVPVSLDYSFKGHARSILTDIMLGIADVVLRTIFIAYSAYLMSDAIIRTIFRLCISRRNLLEWRTTWQVKKSSSNTLVYYLQLMWPAMLIAVMALLLPLLLDSKAIVVASFFTFLWFLSPLIAWIVSHSARSQDMLKVYSTDKTDLRCIGRRTWRYFENFVTAENNYLPVDNFQEDPFPLVAARTSPTNIGLYLLSIVSARDFGWISFDDTLKRIDDTLSSVEKMEKYRGHLYNWYETTDLKPLMPLYISTVDSGNFAGHLVTLSSTLAEWAEAPSVYIQNNIDGILDVNDILEETISEIPNNRRVRRPLRRRLDERVSNFRRAGRAIKEESETASLRTANLALFATDILRLTNELHREIASPESLAAIQWAYILVDTCKAHTDDVTGEHDLDMLHDRLHSLSTRARQIAFNMRFDFLERKERRLLSIGYRVQENELDEACYDLLASEARLSSLFAIAKGDIAVEHWSRLGRLLVPVGWKGALLSWSGSMFEYLMPPLVMIEPLGSMLDQTNKLIVKRQIEYAISRGLPWGISEAAYNARDSKINYQYSNFGIPTLGLKRGLSKNAVIAPYASLLAAQYRPAEAVANLKRLCALGALGPYGFYDAVDFTPSRVREGEKCAVVHNYYAHHHGMSIVAINNVIFNGRMRERFHRDPVIESAELLLQEKAPREIPMIRTKIENPLRADSGDFENAPMRIVATPLKAPRTTQLMSNGQYAVMLTANGTGYSRWNGLAITRFQADAAEDMQGTFLFLRDIETGNWWSATGEPTRKLDGETQTTFTDDKVEFSKTVGDIKTVVECIVASETNGEGRHINIINIGTQDHIIEVTSYAELVLTSSDVENAHPAFAKMFVETEITNNNTTIYATRRKRALSDTDIHVAHFVTDLTGTMHHVQAETDRRVFIGRGRNLKNPIVFEPDVQLMGSKGCVLDTIASLRCQIRVPAHKKISLVFWMVAGDSRQSVEDAVSHYRHPECFARESSLSWTRAQIRLHHIGISPTEAAEYQKIATHLLYPNRTLRQPSETIAMSLGKQSELWSVSISGDFPIFVLRMESETDLDVLSDLLKAQEYWRSKGFLVDVVAINEYPSTYHVQDFHRNIEWMSENYRTHGAQQGAHEHIFTLCRNQISEATYNTLLASACIVMHAQNGSLSEQLRRMQGISSDLAARSSTNQIVASKQKNVVSLKQKSNTFSVQTKLPTLSTKFTVQSPPNGDDLQFWNGYGGFDEKGDYIVRLNGQRTTPHPWINIISNPSFGFHVSAEGAGFTWSGNSRDYQVTPWSNDPVTNRTGEAIYIVDRDTGAAYSPVAAVLRDETVSYEAKHGHGYSLFSSQHVNVALTLTHIVDPEKPIRLSKLIIANRGRDVKRLRLYGYVEWVLGNVRAKNAAFIIPSYDPKLGALFAKNPYHIEKADHVAFFAASQQPDSVTADRVEFIGTTGCVDRPDTITQGKTLSNTVEAGRDPCATLAFDLDIEAGEEKEITFFIGTASSQDEAHNLITEYKEHSFEEIFKTVCDVWHGFFSGLQVKTPDPSFDLMVNRWLPYQGLACRIWARTAFYQASGAYGFRDQLQDTLAFLMLDPSLARRQILNAATRQFHEGDVQHWWLPETGAGVRTLIADDVVWLGYAAALYTEVTGDIALLDEQVPFLKGPALKEGEHDAFYQPTLSEDMVSIYEHCAMGLDLAVARTGQHGLPLMLGGDWNDGMNLVGIHGQGESVWLGWFLSYTLNHFIPIALSRKDEMRAKAWQHHVDTLKVALEKKGWDGEWYCRGYYDDGAPLGAKESDECCIDAIAQSWAVLSGVADPVRAEKAMQSVRDHLLDKEGELLRLFTPPFDKTMREPGYIKGYPPGVRENGGQYTHAAAWVILALVRLGQNAEAYRWFQMMNPIHHSRNAESYRVEPYVMAADVYSVEPRRGQGGWTWYTGSAGWFYRIATEGILGIQRQANRLIIDPALPPDWDGCRVSLRIDEARYHITIKTGAKTLSMKLDGKKVSTPKKGIALVKDGDHDILVELPKHLSNR